MSYTGGNIADLYQDAERIADDAVREIADACGNAVTETARALAPVSLPFGSQLSPPGALKASYRQSAIQRFHRIDGNTGYSSGVESDDPAALWAEHGVKGHVVKAKRGKYLTFRNIAGQLIRVPFVTQRGYEGKHIVTRALAITEVRFAEIAEPALRRWKARQEAASSGR